MFTPACLSLWFTIPHPRLSTKKKMVRSLTLPSFWTSLKEWLHLFAFNPYSVTTHWHLQFGGSWCYGNNFIRSCLQYDIFASILYQYTPNLECADILHGLIKGFTVFWIQLANHWLAFSPKGAISLTYAVADITWWICFTKSFRLTKWSPKVARQLTALSGYSVKFFVWMSPFTLT